MTSDIDVMSNHAETLASDLRDYLAETLHIAVRVREMTKRGAGYRIYQVGKPKNRPLVDVRQEATLPASISKRGVRFVEPATLIAMKVTSYVARRNQIKGDTDRADVRRMLAVFPRLRKLHGDIATRLLAMGASETVMEAWAHFVSERLEPDNDEY